MNLNIGFGGHEGEYDLLKSQTQEVINIYGIYTKYLIAEKVNQDKIFGEHSHIKVDNDEVYEMFMLPEETEAWGGGGDLFSKFGLQNLDTLGFFIGVEDMEKIHPNIVNREGKGFDGIIGNLVVLPNNKIMEVTGFDIHITKTSDILFSSKK